MSEQHFHKKYIRYTTRGRSASPLKEAGLFDKEAGLFDKEAGLFDSAYRLRDENLSSASEQQELQQCLGWFQRHVRLACLDELCDLDQQARCWYKNPAHKDHAALNHSSLNNTLVPAESMTAEVSIFTEANVHQALSQTEMLAGIMQRHGFIVHVAQTSQPGVILYEDQVQVAAISAQNAWHSLHLRIQLWWKRNIPQFC